MRILCLDIGEKRIGVAISDPLGISAQGLGVLQRKGIKKDLAEIRRYVEDYQAGEIILGLPLNMNGSRGKKAEEILRLQDFLSEKIQIPVKTWDERLTTIEAQKVLLAGDVSRAGRKKVIDKLAAVLILDNYLRYKARF
ncbi:MAG TPA: Holliday junction resolvase RuvX [Firmicutes bacterium]|jgi:putative Holliday junction resolvase|nr:Holliday junction resolvase RuvX [Bacillota bacterium]